MTVGVGGGAAGALGTFGALNMHIVEPPLYHCLPRADVGEGGVSAIRALCVVQNDVLVEGLGTLFSISAPFRVPSGVCILGLFKDRVTQEACPSTPHQHFR